MRTDLTAQVMRALVGVWFVLSAGEYAPLSACEAHRGAVMVLAKAADEASQHSRAPSLHHHPGQAAAGADASDALGGASLPSHEHGSRCCCSGGCDSPPAALLPASPTAVEPVSLPPLRLPQLREAATFTGNHGVRLPPANGPPSSLLTV